MARKDHEQARTVSGYVVGGLYYSRQGLEGVAAVAASNTARQMRALC